MIDWWYVWKEKFGWIDCEFCKFCWLVSCSVENRTSSFILKDRLLTISFLAFIFWLEIEVKYMGERRTQKIGGRDVGETYTEW